MDLDINDYIFLEYDMFYKKHGFVKRNISNAEGLLLSRRIGHVTCFFNLVCLKENKALAAGILYENVANIVVPILVNNGILGENALNANNSSITLSSGSELFYQDFDNLSDFHKENLPIIVENPSDIDKFIATHREFYERFAEPFFREWSDMRKLLPYLENATPRETWQILGSGAVFKKLAIWKLCSHPRYESEIERSIAGFKDQKESNPSEVQYTRFLNSALDLRAALSQIEPLYEWDESYLQRK